MSNMEPSWRFYFEGDSGFRDIYYSLEEAEEYARTIPQNVGYKVVNEYAEVVFQKDPAFSPMAESYKDGWKDVQSTTHGRTTRYGRVQAQLLPSAFRGAYKKKQ